MMRKRLLAIGLLAVILLSGCHKGVTLTDSDKVNQNYIFQLYQVKYDAESGEMTAKAVFRLDHRSGEQLRLTSPSQVTANGKVLDLNDQGEYVYSAEKHQQTTSYVYTNNDQQQFKNSVITNTIAFSQENITLHKDKVTRVAIKAEPFEENESVSCTLTKDGETVEIDLDFENGRLIVSPEMLETVQPGSYSARLVRNNYSQQLKSLDRGGEWESQYVSTSKTITVQ